MGAESLTNARTNLPNVYTNVTAREIDFVTRFNKNWDDLREILGIMRPIKKAPGTRLVAYKAKVTLESGDVQPGCVIPYSQTQIEQVGFEDLTIKKYAKGVPVEDLDKYGAEIAVEKSDEAFLTELQLNVLNQFYSFLNTGSLLEAAPSFQAALAKAKGIVVDKFQKMNKTVTEIVGFANVLDFYDYLGSADITVQTAFGMTYVKNFLGYSTLILLSEPNIARGKVIACPKENIDLYYIDPADSEFAKLGLNYAVEGETNLIGFHTQGAYNTAVGESYALMGMKLWAEYLDGIGIVTIDDATLTDVTVSADSPDATYPWTSLTPADFQSNVAVNGGAITGTLKYIEDGLASSGPLAGSGYFLAVKFDNFASGLTYANCQVGLVPSASGMALQTLDSDKNAVFKITDKVNQKLEVVQTDTAGHKNVQFFDLSGLTLEVEGA